MKCDELKSLKNIGLSFDTTTLHKQVIAEDSEGKCYGFDSWEEIYLKSDVDAAIAELKAENERLNAIRKVHVEAIESMGAGLLQDDKEIRHQKYKRCLAMAKWCDAERDIFNLTPKVTKVEFFARWHKRWLGLAEVFK